MHVYPLQPTRLDEAPEAGFDLLVGGIGYERRSVAVPLSNAGRANRTALIDLSSAGVGSYAENLQMVAGAQAEVCTVETNAIPQWIYEQISHLEATSVPRVGVDVSSLSRDRIARITEGFLLVEADRRPVEITLLYTPATYRTIATSPQLIQVLGPVTSKFAGFSATPTAPVVAFVGLGIEQDRAIGAIEFLEPNESWVFLPEGEDTQFDKALLTANDLVLDTVPEERRVRYRVDDPYALYVALEELVFSELEDGRPILVPLGPKIFAICCALVAAQHPKAGLWRVSSGTSGPHRQATASGKLVRLGLRLGARA